jgi:hypothetical protein
VVLSWGRVGEGEERDSDLSQKVEAATDFALDLVLGTEDVGIILLEPPNTSEAYQEKDEGLVVDSHKIPTQKTRRDEAVDRAPVRAPESSLR